MWYADSPYIVREPAAIVTMIVSSIALIIVLMTIFLIQLGKKDLPRKTLVRAFEGRA